MDSLTPEQRDVVLRILRQDAHHALGDQLRPARPAAAPGAGAGGEDAEFGGDDLDVVIEDSDLHTILVLEHYNRTQTPATTNTWSRVQGTELWPGSLSLPLRGGKDWVLLDEDERAHIGLSLKALYPNSTEFQFDQYRVYRNLTVGSWVFGSVLGRESASYILVRWGEVPGKKGKAPVRGEKRKKPAEPMGEQLEDGDGEAMEELEPEELDPSLDNTWRPAQVQRYIRLQVQVDGKEPLVHCLAEVRWFADGSVKDKWHNRYKYNLFEAHRAARVQAAAPVYSRYTYIPVQRIARGFVPLTIRDTKEMHLGWLRSPLEF
jgi:hypothetical protein